VVRSHRPTSCAVGFSLQRPKTRLGGVRAQMAAQYSQGEVLLPFKGAAFPCKGRKIEGPIWRYVCARRAVPVLWSAAVSAAPMECAGPARAFSGGVLPRP
jgi:hypothetical protein